MTGPVGALIAIAVAGVVIAGLLSAGEVAVLRVTRSAAAEEIERSPRRARHLATFMQDPSSTAAAAGFARIVAEMASTACITLSFDLLFHAWWQVLGLAILVSTLVALLLVRLSPHTVGRRHPVGVLVALSGLMLAALRTFGWALRLTQRAAVDADVEYELREMVERVSESDVIEEEERELFKSVLELGGTLTREVMVPRTDMVTISYLMDLDQALALFVRSGFSRIPVIGESEDDLRGIIYLKDMVALLHTIQSQHEGGSRAVHQFMRPAHYVPESKPVDDLLRELQVASSHMAIVVDEYGGIAGLVTMEDTLEEIIGEVTDEHDRVLVDTTELSDGVFRISARLGIEELGELFDLDIDDDEVDTAAGLLAKALGKVPLLGAEAEIYGVHLSAERIEGRRKRLATLLVRRADRSKRLFPDTVTSKAGRSHAEQPSHENQTKQRRSDRKSES